jgi:hypothetical protein
MLMTMTSTTYPLAQKILMRRYWVLLEVLKVPDWTILDMQAVARID